MASALEASDLGVAVRRARRRRRRAPRRRARARTSRGLLADPAAVRPKRGTRRRSRAPQRLVGFDRVDYFPRAMREAAEYVARTDDARRSRPDVRDGRVPPLPRAAKERDAVHLRLRSQRRRRAHGSFDPTGSIRRPSEAERIRAMRDAHASDLAARLERAPPAAFVFVDRSPLMSWRDAVADFSAHCPEAAAWCRVALSADGRLRGDPRVAEG